MPRHDVAIYAPQANRYYDAASPVSGGGAERQTYLLARTLARRGLRVAHIVYPVTDRIDDPDAPVTLIEYPVPRELGPSRDLFAKSGDVWRALGKADARVQVFRGANGTLGVAGAWCRLHRRKLIFAGANNSDFDDSGFNGRNDPRARLFSAGMRAVDAVVVQSADQERLAHARFPRLDVTQVNSFVEPAAAADAPGEAFLWVSRLVDYKRPLLFADLAAEVPEARFWLVPIKTEDPEYESTLAELHQRAAVLDNFEVLAQRPHAELQELISRAVAMVNTSSFEGMPNTWLEGWARGVPALTFSFDPDGRIAANALGEACEGSWDRFVAGARGLWERRADARAVSAAVQTYVAAAHGSQVAEQWASLITRL